MRTHLAMEALRVLPSDGIPDYEVEDLPLARIAEAAGYRHASSLARALKRCPPLIKTEPHWGAPSHREWNFPPSTRERGKKKVWKGQNMPTAVELSQHHTLGKYFRNAKGRGGYHKRPGFIFDKHFPGTPNDRTVLAKMAELDAFSKGLLEDATQRYLSAETGLCLDTICSIIRKYSIYLRKVFERNAEGQLRAKKVPDGESGGMKSERIEERGQFPLFRIINRPARYMKDGQVLDRWEEGAVLRQPPNKIVYIGDRMLDPRTGVLETQRLMALATAKAYTAELWWHHVAKVHGTLLGQWIGTERYVGTLWDACRMQIQSEGLRVPLKALVDLFPEWRPPD